jgi:flagellar biosynthesis/type III secretory pathway protein FliH
MLETLGDNRDLQANLDEAKAMLTEVDVKKFASYNWGLRAGVEKGIEQGIEQGIEKGIEQGIKKGIEQGDIKRALSVAKKLLQKNQMSNEDIADITSLPIAQIEALSRDLMN